MSVPLPVLSSSLFLAPPPSLYLLPPFSLSLPLLPITLSFAPRTLPLSPLIYLPISVGLPHSPSHSSLPPPLSPSLPSPLPLALSLVRSPISVFHPLPLSRAVAASLLSHPSIPLRSSLWQHLCRHSPIGTRLHVPSLCCKTPFLPSSALALAAASTEARHLIEKLPNQCIKFKIFKTCPCICNLN